MTRRCGTCEWGRYELADASLLLDCREGPERYAVHPEHWCGRWRIRENEAGGKDARGADA